MTVDEYVRVEHFKVEQFVRLGLDGYAAVCAVDAGSDWHDVERFIEQHPNCPVEIAARITRPIDGNVAAFCEHLGVGSDMLERLLAA